jgi:hypothetical protein
LGKVVRIEVRKWPADAGARRVLAELAQDTREKVRECRLAIDYYQNLPDGAGEFAMVKLYERIAELYTHYQDGRNTVAEADTIGDSLQARVMRQYGIELAPPKGLPPEKLLRHVDYERVMARRQRIAAARQPRQQQSSIPPKRRRTR